MFAWIFSFIICLIEQFGLYQPPSDATFYDDTVQRATLSNGTVVAHTMCHHGIWIDHVPTGTPIVVFFHGNATSLRSCAPFMQQVSREMEAVVVPMEYRNYVNGETISSSTTATATESLLEDAVAFCSLLHAANPASPLFLWGHSLGTGVAIHVATSPELMTVVKGVILVSPYLSIISVVNHTLATWVPFVDVLQSYRRVADMLCPMISFAGTEDKLIRPWHSIRLFELQNRKGNTYLLNGADHNSTMIQKYMPVLVGKISLFMIQCMN